MPNDSAYSDYLINKALAAVRTGLPGSITVNEFNKVSNDQRFIDCLRAKEIEFQRKFKINEFEVVGATVLRSRLQMDKLLTNFYLSKVKLPAELTDSECLTIDAKSAPSLIRSLRAASWRVYFLQIRENTMSSS